MSRPISTNRLVRSAIALGAAILVVLIAAPARAQVTPAAGYTPPDDTPSIKLGTTIFADYTFQQQPQVKDSDGNNVRFNAFNISRAYINLTGNVSHIVTFRVTGDVSRETGSGSSLNGSLTYRLKYAFAQFNLDDWMWKGSWVRLGVQHTPYVDYIEQIYRYRFQGTIFAERDGFLTSSDAALAFRTAFPGNYGDLHVGIYNGDGYSKAEANDQKALQVRASFRPLPMSPILRGLRVTGFYDGDNYVKNGERKRAIFDVTFEHKYLNAGFDYLDAKDQTSATKTSVHGQGWSAWATPRTTIGVEALLRYDDLKPNTTVDGRRKRTIAGVAYWFPHQGSATAALLLDYEQVTFANIVPAQPRQQRIALHGLIGF
jgi:hypothetical protein